LRGLGRPRLDLAGERLEMVAVAREPDLRPIKRSQGERRLADRPGSVAEPDQAPEEGESARPVLERTLGRSSGHCSGCTWTGAGGAAPAGGGATGAGAAGSGGGAVVAGGGLPRTCT